MVITGFMMWNPIATTNILPGQIVPAAKAAHGAEAVLAILAIIIWHLYHVLVKTFNRSMYNGKLSEEQMLHEHPLELADIKAGIDKPVTTAEGIARRSEFSSHIQCRGCGVDFWDRLFHHLRRHRHRDCASFRSRRSGGLCPADTDASRRRSSPTPAASSPGLGGGIGPLLESKCGGCHNGSSLIGGLDLTTYQGAMKGGNSGPAVVPGDAQAGTLIQVQSAGGHPGQLTDEALAPVSVWIAAGAPEN
jgi:hypothetical protein